MTNKNDNFFLRVDPVLANFKGALEYGLWRLATGERPKNGVVTKTVKTVRVELSSKCSDLVDDLLEKHQDITSKQQACRLALSIIDEGPKHVKFLKNFKL